MLKVGSHEYLYSTCRFESRFKARQGTPAGTPGVCLGMTANRDEKS
ncbi:hypothetical protein ASZ90_005801 [hydrocarbon metagenome]|uniref:Uncharacterized protein n=1 Tax=hydrocarbon metagenome TaxID=938273 RepID=A0A0W8FTS7_9ZZZZ